MMGCCSCMTVSFEDGRPHPLIKHAIRLGGRAASLTHKKKKKKKKKKWKEAEAGVVWRWKLHMGNECGSYASVVEWEGV